MEEQGRTILEDGRTDSEDGLAIKQINSTLDELTKKIKSELDEQVKRDD